MLARALPRASLSTPKASSTPPTGWVKPIANSTRSALISNSEPGTSAILPSLNSRRQALSALTLPFLPMNSLVATAKSRSQPSSCEDEVRSLVGQYGHTSGLFSCSGGIGISSNWVTLAAPWRFEVPTQSEPVSPPPITTTCLPLAEIGLGLSPATCLFCGIRNSSAKCTPPSSRPGTGRSRGTSEPPASTTASNSCCNCSALMTSLASLTMPAGMSLAATTTPVRKRTPSACICSTRRSISDFSILKSGMP